MKFTRPSHGQIRVQAPSASLLFCAIGCLAVTGIDVYIRVFGGFSIRANHIHLLTAGFILITTAAHVCQIVGLCRVPVINKVRIEVLKTVNCVNDVSQNFIFFTILT